ncbi:MAG: hydroxymyristoyl-ACP dehydratase [Rudaea sp.]
MTPSADPSMHGETFSVAASHPALPGHFPQAPVVPGVVMLDRVIAAIERAWALRVTGLPQVKFLHPLLPDQHARLTLSDRGQRVHFQIVHATATIASGQVEVAR